MMCWLGSGVGLLLPLAVKADQVTMVKDIITGVTGSNPQNLTNASGLLYFTVDDGVHGNELWKSDGTAAGTFMVKDINRGSASSNPTDLTSVGDVLYFIANDGTSDQVYVTDGKGKNIVSKAAGVQFGNITDVNGQAYFTGNIGGSGVELWQVGHKLPTLFDINQGSSGSEPSNLTNVNGTLVFSASDGVHGRELWRTDGTIASTMMVKDINPNGDGTGTMYTENFLKIGRILYFNANDGVHGYELWKSNGTPAGTVLVSGIYTDGTYDPLYGYDGYAAFSDFYDFNGVLYFHAETPKFYQTWMWKSDGTATGTVEVLSLGAYGKNYGPLMFTRANGLLYFLTYPSASGGVGILHKTDGTTAGTGQLLYYVNSLTSINNTLYFRHSVDFPGQSIYMNDLWKSDGTAAGSVLVKSFQANAGNFTRVNGTMYFTADDGVHGSELWKLVTNGHVNQRCD